MRANGARSPRGPALLLTPPPAHGCRADKGASWRPRLAVAVGGGLNPAPGLTFSAASAAAPRACSPDRPHRPSPLIHLPPAKLRSRPPTHLREPKRTWVGDTCDMTVAGAFLVPSLWGRRLLEGQRGQVPLFSQSASASFPHRRRRPLGYALTMLQGLPVSETRTDNHSTRSLHSD